MAPIMLTMLFVLGLICVAVPAFAAVQAVGWTLHRVGGAVDRWASRG